jgi:hypothetical protein
MAPDRGSRQSASRPRRSSAGARGGTPLDRVRSHLREADPVLARLIDARPAFDPGGWMAELPAMVLSGDLARRKAVRRAYELDHLPSPAEVLVIAEKWRPYGSVATSYLFSAAFEEPGSGATSTTDGRTT